MGFTITAADLLNDDNFIIIDGNGCAMAIEQLFKYQGNNAFFGVCLISELGLSTSVEAKADIKKS